MFNSPVLDTAIGVVFIFLLYSLLATSINEAISTLLGLRARMLRKGIIDGMLSDTSKDNAWLSWIKSVKDFLTDTLRIFLGKDYKYGNGLGAAVYKHPIIKNYGSQRRFSVPSYITSANFSTVLIDSLKDYSESLMPVLATANNISTEAFNNLPTITKIKYLVTYLIGSTPEQLESVLAKNSIVIDKDTLQILQLHLRKSYLNIDEFTKRIEGWYNDSMNRVTGWYKRQVQLILFIIGLTIGLIFNVDILEITNKLSTDKDARDKLVQMAIKASDEYKDDPRVKSLIMKLDTAKVSKDTTLKTLDSIKTDSKKYETEAKKMIDGDINEANNLLAIGWKEYGVNDTAYLKNMDTLKDACWLVSPFHSTVYAILKKYNDTAKVKSDSVNVLMEKYKKIYKANTRTMQIWYIWHNITPKKILGFLILAFAVCLGAPFWFDLLQKLVKLRATGKKEESGNSNDGINTATTTTPPTQVVITNNTNTEEAVG